LNKNSILQSIQSGFDNLRVFRRSLPLHKLAFCETTCYAAMIK